MVVAVISEDIAEPGRYQSCTISKIEGSSKHETCATIEWYSAYNAHIGISKCTKQKDRHNAEDTGWDRVQSS